MPTVGFSVLVFVLVVKAHGPHHPKGNKHQHHQPDSGIKLTQNEQLLRDKEHIKEDLHDAVKAGITDDMSPEELEFYYFKIHDADNNTKLDGLEILTAIQHASHNEELKGSEDFQSLVDLIDRVLAEDDLNNDGFLSYVEYVQGRERDQLSSKKRQQG